METESAPEVMRRGRATQAELEELHALVCNVLLTAVRTMQETGEPHTRLLAVAVGFLKVAGVTAPQGNAAAMNELLDAMPDFDEFDSLPSES